MSALSDYLQHKKILILGMGREGRSSLRWLRAHVPTAQIALADQKDPGIDGVPGFFGADFSISEEIFAIPSCFSFFVEGFSFAEESRPLPVLVSFKEAEASASLSIRAAPPGVLSLTSSPNGTPS